MLCIAHCRPAGEISDRNERYKAFFQELIDTLREQHRFTGATKARPQSWYGFASGRSHITYNGSFRGGNRASVEIYLNRDKEANKSIFDSLKQSKLQIERDLESVGISWERLDDRMASRIAVYTDGSIDDSDEDLETIQVWMIDRLLKFKEVFGPYLTELI